MMQKIAAPRVPPGPNRPIRRATASVLIVSACAVSPSWSTEFYHCVGANGEVAYQDRPCSETGMAEHQSTERSSSSADTGSPLPGGTGAPWVSFAFESSLESDGDISLEPKVVGKQARYEVTHGRTALHTRGANGWVEYRVRDPLRLDGGTTISFDFKADRWINPEPNGGVAQTICSLFHMKRHEMFHVSFGFYQWQGRRPYVHFRSENGSTHRLVARDESVRTDWHSMRLIVHPRKGETTFYFDGDRVDAVQAVPAFLGRGVEKIVVGTRRKEVQAYRGWIDNLAIAPF